VRKDFGTNLKMQRLQRTCFMDLQYVSAGRGRIT